MAKGLGYTSLSEGGSPFFFICVFGAIHAIPLQSTLDASYPSCCHHLLLLGQQLSAALMGEILTWAGSSELLELGLSPE